MDQVKEFALPNYLPETLKSLTREILREQPEDLERFCFDYFDARVANLERRGTAETLLADSTEESALALAVMSPDEVEEVVFKFFKEQDLDGNRTLDRQEFKRVFTHLGSKLGLDNFDILRILAEADKDENGEITFAEFIPVAVGIIETIVAKYQWRENEQMIAKAHNQAEEQIYHGLPESELDEMLGSIFREADVDGNGTLDMEEFETCLKDIRIGITKKEINLIMFEAYSDSDGKIDYEGFKPFCKQLLVELATRDWITPNQDAATLEARILDLSGINEENGGLFPSEYIQNKFQEGDFGLTLIQICSILAEATEDENGLIDITDFAPKAAFMIHSCQNYRKLMADKRAQMEQLYASEGVGYVLGRDRHTLQDELRDAFHAADTHKTGFLPREQIRSIVKSVLDVDNKTVSAVLQFAKRGETGDYAYEPLVDNAYQALKKLLELAIIYE